MLDVFIIEFSQMYAIAESAILYLLGDPINWCGTMAQITLKVRTDLSMKANHVVRVILGLFHALIRN